MDEHDFEITRAWSLVSKVFSYTNHTILPEALEKWSVELINKLLPRHLELIYDINYLWMEKVRDLTGGDIKKMERLSLIEESNPK